MVEQEKVRCTIKKTVEDICGITLIDETSNLLEDSVGIMLADWIYVFEELFVTYHYPIFEIIENMDSQKFTVDGLSKEIIERI